jgi:hypothetical protein
MLLKENESAGWLHDYFSHSRPEIESLLNTPSLLDNAWLFTLRHLKKQKVDKYADSYLSDSNIDDNFRQFHLFLHQRVFGRKYRHPLPHKKKPKIKGLAYLHEPTQHYRLTSAHIHLLLIKPDDLDPEIFFGYVSSSWERTPFGVIGESSHWFDCRKVFSPGILSYQSDQQRSYDSTALSHFML